MKKILIVTDSYYKQLGGSYEAIGSTVYNLKQNNFSIKFVYFKNETISMKLKIKKLINYHDIIHFFGIWTFNHFKTIILCILFNKSFIVTPMGALEPWSLNQKKIKKKLALFFYQIFFLKKSKFVHCTSINEEKNIKKIDSKIKTMLIPHAMEGINYIKTQINIRKKIKFLFFSRIHRKKGLDSFLTAWNNVKPKNFELDIIGPDADDTKNEIEYFVKKNNLEHQIKFKKPIYNMLEKNKLFQKYHISILTSKNENFAYSVIESLRHSLPVITNINVPWEEIKTHNAGWYINDDVDSIKKTLIEISKITENELLQKSRNAYKLSKKYEWKNIIERYDCMYNN